MSLYRFDQYTCYRDEDGVVHQLRISFNGMPYMACTDFGPVHAESKRLTVTCLRCISRPR